MGPKMEDNKTARPVPSRNSYGFENIPQGKGVGIGSSYMGIDFKTRTQAIRARAAAHTIGNRTGKKFVTEIVYNDAFKDLRHMNGQEVVKATLHVWRID
jgi:hypothetical protein